PGCQANLLIPLNLISDQTLRELVAINPLLAGSGADRLVAVAEGVILTHLGIQTDYGQVAT
ncbi:hypothetical protein ACFONL_13450, partial [Camelimonas fluminis]